MARNRTLSIVCILVMLVMLSSPLVSLAAVTKSFIYSPVSNYQGVIESDRFDYMNADGNPLKEDTANYVFQGVGPLGSNTTGYMKDIFLTITKWGTINQLNYTGENRPGHPEDGNRRLEGPAGDGKYHWLPVIEQTPPPTADKTPLEGWAIAYNVTGYAAPIVTDVGYLAVTFSGYTATGGLKASVIGQDSDDDWIVTLVDKEVWVDNPRLLAIFYNISAVNDKSPFYPNFELDMVVVFNKATKFVEIFMKLKLVDIYWTECGNLDIEFALARMAIFDANPYCDRAYYGWKNVTISDPDVFIVLSYTNKTLAAAVGAAYGYDYYGCYMATYPTPDSWAIGSTWYDSNDTDSYSEACNIWNAIILKNTYYTVSNQTFYLDKYVWLNMMGGDQALVRVEWYAEDSGLPEEIEGTFIDWKMVMYGVYDVNGTFYDGGEGGWFKYGYLRLSNGDEYTDFIDLDLATPPATDPPPYPWIHTGTLGWLNGNVSNTDLKASEEQLTKLVFYIDIDQDGNKDEAEDDDLDPVNATDEYDIPQSWWPSEELYWQLHFKFGPPVFKKYNTTCCFFKWWDQPQEVPKASELIEVPEVWDFTVVPAPGATPDAAGAAWLNARFTSLLVLFDVEAYNMTATVGYTNPDLKMLPYLMLRLGEASTTAENYAARRSRYLTSDKRALPQMEFEDIPWLSILAGTPQEIQLGTPWHDVHYLLVTVAGVRPNLATYYFNDFTQIPFALGGDRPGSYVVLPYGGPVDITPYSGSKKTMGLAVIALARDHFNNTALVVTATDAQDTYWSAWITTWGWKSIKDPAGLGNWSAVMWTINYTDITNNWGDGTGIPIAHPNYPLVNSEPVFTLVANATEYACELDL